MLHQKTLTHSLYATAVIAILTLTGIFSTFESRELIEDTLNLSTILLAVMAGSAAFLVASPVREGGLLSVTVNALVASGLVAFVLTLIVVLENNINLRFVFQNLSPLNEGTLTAGREISLETGDIGGLLLMIGYCLISGIIGGLLVLADKRIRETLLLSFTLTVVLGLTSSQIDSVIALPDALMLVVVVAASYVSTFYLPVSDLYRRLGVGFAIGAGIALVLALIGNAGGLVEGGILLGTGGEPRILLLSTTGNFIPFILIIGVIGALAALLPESSRSVHNGGVFFIGGLLLLSILDWQGDLQIWTTLLIFGLLAAMIWFVPPTGQRADSAFEARPVSEQRNIQRLFFISVMLIALVAPQFMGLYISNVFNLVALYAVMGIGLNVMIGYTGLLDLGYVASFAIGAYTLGILTTPNVLTCGGVDTTLMPPAETAEICTGMLTFWQAWPLCVLFSALTGAALGIPVLRLRGDYLAIVTLGFGEIINRIILSNDFKDYLGGAQGISPIPVPVIDATGIQPEWFIEMNNSTSIYYLFLFSVILTAFVVSQLAQSRTGRAWRAVKADENVAEAMGINLVHTKLLAFGVSSAFAGLGGAAFGASVQGIFPNSFTLLVSINVLSLIIIGGMGSIPGVFVGALILIGLPELLRELDTYRFLAFGVLLVTVMIVKPDGLLPPQPPELSERVHGTPQSQLKEGVQHG